jgi:gamma-glutamylcyclotransferase (GGCT)/AIG2-like uncharacterized protein YtfP
VSHRVIVYGLLRKGQSMAHLMAGARSVGRVDVEGYDLLNMGPYPAAVPGDGGIVGELYSLPTDSMLALLDEAEGVHAEPPLYYRESVDGRGKPAWIYVYARDPECAPKIPSGDWL